MKNHPLLLSIATVRTTTVRMDRSRLNLFIGYLHIIGDNILVGVTTMA